MSFQSIAWQLMSEEDYGAYLEEKMNQADIYDYNGFDSREDYLQDLAGQYGVDLSIVQALSDVLGPNEDFDGLVTALEDM